MMNDREAEAYDRGHFVATQRAINRQALGLPLEYGASKKNVWQPFPENDSATWNAMAERHDHPMRVTRGARITDEQRRLWREWTTD